MAGVSGSPTALEFDYWITEEHEGKGIITRCISTLMDYAIDEMGIQRFVIGCEPMKLGYPILGGYMVGIQKKTSINWRFFFAKIWGF